MCPQECKLDFGDPKLVAKGREFAAIPAGVAIAMGAFEISIDFLEPVQGPFGDGCAHVIESDRGEVHDVLDAIFWTSGLRAV